MIRNPNPGLAKKLFVLISWVFITAFRFPSIAHSADAKFIEVTLPETIVTDKEISINIRLLDEEKNLIKKDARHLKLDIVNNDIIDEKQISLRNGQAKVTYIFKKQGATLLTVYDPNNRYLVNYSGFDVTVISGGK